jgi:hypothetical protein
MSASAEDRMTDPKVGRFKKTLAAICSNCPICNHARAHPESWLGRVLHHPLHADHCPFWKAERDVTAGCQTESG